MNKALYLYSEIEISSIKIEISSIKSLTQLIQERRMTPGGA